MNNLEQKPQRRNNNRWMEVFDVFFIMVLCFVVLLVTMLVQKHSGVASIEGYIINPLTLGLVVVFFIFYFVFVLSRSNRELKELLAIELEKEKKD